jgi:hypothetical protein
MAERRLDFRAFEISRENLPGSVEHNLSGGQDAVLNQHADDMTSHSERSRSFPPSLLARADQVIE